MEKQTINSRRQITAEEAKKMLMDKDRDLLAIDKKMNLLYDEMMKSENDEFIRAAAMPGKPVDVLRLGSGSRVDNMDILLRYNKQKQERLGEIRVQMWKLSEEAEDIRRLWNCFLALREPYYSILHELYVKKELYAVVQCSSGFSHRIFEERRKEGLCLLADMFSSGYSTLELMEMAGQKEKTKARKEKRAGCPGQMELPLARMSGETDGKGQN